MGRNRTVSLEREPAWCDPPAVPAVVRQSRWAELLVPVVAAPGTWARIATGDRDRLHHRVGYLRAKAWCRSVTDGGTLETSVVPLDADQPHGPHGLWVRWHPYAEVIDLRQRTARCVACGRLFEPDSPLVRPCPSCTDDHTTEASTR